MALLVGIFILLAVFGGAVGVAGIAAMVLFGSDE